MKPIINTNKILILSLFIILLSFIGIYLVDNSKIATANNFTTTKISAYFSTGGSSPQNEIIKLINNSKKSIKVACYVFTSKPISQALLKANKRGVVIDVVADSKANKQYSAVTFLRNNGINVKLVSKYAIQHNKFMIFDDVVLQTGSYNYTYSAENKNAENIVVTNDNIIISNFIREWNKLNN